MLMISAVCWDIRQRRMVMVMVKVMVTVKVMVKVKVKVKDYHSTLRNVPEEWRS
jgi:hypothetical protein